MQFAPQRADTGGMTPRPSFLRAALHVARTHRLLWVFAALAVLVVTALFLVIGLNPVFGAFLLVLVLAVAVGLLTLRHRRAGSPERLSGATVAAHAAIAVVATFALVQAVPYGRAHANPTGSGEPAWSSPRTRELMVNACFDCHSNDTQWPWYSNVAPFSWAVQNHVDEARDKVNYSDFVADPGKADDTVEVIQNGSMPPGYYTALGRHPKANLTDAEVQELIAGLQATPGMGDGERGGRGGGDGD